MGKYASQVTEMNKMAAALQELLTRVKASDGGLTTATKEFLVKVERTQTVFEGSVKAIVAAAHIAKEIDDGHASQLKDLEEMKKKKKDPKEIKAMEKWMKKGENDIKEMLEKGRKALVNKNAQAQKLLKAAESIRKALASDTGYE